VICADLLAVLLRESADTLTDPVGARRQGELALVDLLNYLLTPVAGVGAACDGRLACHAGRTNGQKGDCEADGALGRDQGYGVGEN